MAQAQQVTGCHGVDTIASNRVDMLQWGLDMTLSPYRAVGYGTTGVGDGPPAFKGLDRTYGGVAYMSFRINDLAGGVNGLAVAGGLQVERQSQQAQHAPMQGWNGNGSGRNMAPMGW